MNRILLQLGTETRKLISLRQKQKEGSLYITFTRAGTSKSTIFHHIEDLDSKPELKNVIEEPLQNRWEIHYHTSGRINFPGPEIGSIYCEPLTRLTQSFWFGSLIIPNFERLDTHCNSIKENDLILTIDGSKKKCRQFDLCISPAGEHLTYGKSKGFFTYAPFYTLNIVETEKPVLKSDIKDCEKFIFIAPRVGLFPKQQLTKESAHIDFLQKRMRHNGPVAFGPNGNHEYRVVFPIPATIIPTVNAVLPDKNWVIDIKNTSKSEVRFQVLDSKGHLVKTPIVFNRVELGECSITLFPEMLLESILK